MYSNEKYRILLLGRRFICPVGQVSLGIRLPHLILPSPSKWTLLNVDLTLRQCFQPTRTSSGASEYWSLRSRIMLELKARFLARSNTLLCCAD